MLPSQVSSALATLVSIRQPAMIHGAPGCGKSQIVKQVAEQLKMQLIDLRLSQLDSVDLRGLPTVTDSGRTDWAIPKFLPTKGKGILFLDEINSANQATQAAAYQLVLDRKLGDYVLPDGWTVVAAGNRTSDFAIVNMMSSALRNRFVHLNFDVSVDDWTNWALKSGVHEAVLSFLKFRPDLLNEIDATEGNAGKKQVLKDAQAFATPRSWEFMSNVLHGKPAPDVEGPLITGAIGEAVGAEFRGFLEIYRELPDMDAVIQDPSKAPRLTNPASLYAYTTALALRTTKETLANVMTLVGKLDLEYQTRVVSMITKRDHTLISSPLLKKWISTNANTLI